MSSWKKIVKAVIPAAGYGTRMLPATRAIPKEMLPVSGKPLIQYAVEEAAASGIETVILVVRDFKSLMRAHFAPAPLFESFLNERGLHASANLVRGLKIRELQKELGQVLWQQVLRRRRQGIWALREFSTR